MSNTETDLLGQSKNSIVSTINGQLSSVSITSRILLYKFLVSTGMIPSRKYKYIMISDIIQIYDISYIMQRRRYNPITVPNGPLTNDDE